MVARELAANRYAEAERLALLALEKAQDAGDDVLKAKILNNLGAARIYRRNYLGAFEALERGRQLAARHGQREVEAGIWSNLASLYGMLGGWPAAQEALARAAALMPASSRFRPALLAQRARLALQRRATDHRLAEKAWAEAMQAATEAADWQIQRHLWDDLFLLRLGKGDLVSAEAALANSYRLIVLHELRDPRQFWLLAARLRLAQGRPAEALACLRRASDGRKLREGSFNALELALVEVQAEYQLRGADAALAACRRVWPEVLQWRDTILPDTTTETAADVVLAQLADQYVKVVLETGPRNPRAAEEAWAAVEQTRALGMLRMRSRRRQALAVTEAGGGPRILMLARASMQTTPLSVAGTLHSPGAGTIPVVAARQLLKAVQAALRPNQTLFTFWMGDARPTVWAITPHSIHCAPLPGRTTLIAGLQRFREEVLRGEAPPGTGRELYRWLFGKLPSTALASTEWMVSGDDELLLAPLGALPMGERDPLYVGQARALSLLPSALWLLEPDQNPPVRSLLAVGNLVHNGADPRWSGTARSNQRGRFALLARTRTAVQNTAALELPTLPGSRRELETICRLWSQAGRETAVLQGFEATMEALRQSLRTEKTDLHFATHVLPAPGAEAYQNQIAGESEGFVRLLFPIGEPFLALSLQRDGRREGLSAADLGALPAVRGRVVLNGCATGTGPAQPGAGIRSFASAWLAAGAASVVASLWQVDDDGALFETYYRALLSGARPSRALHAAQTAMIQSGTWRAQPRYWAAYFHFGKN